MTDKTLVQPGDLLLVIAHDDGKVTPIKIAGLHPGARYVRCVAEGGGFSIDLDPEGLAAQQRTEFLINIDNRWKNEVARHRESLLSIIAEQKDEIDQLKKEVKRAAKKPAKGGQK